MAQALIANNARTTLLSTITASDLVVTVATGTGAAFPTPTGGDYFYITFETSDKTTREIAKCTARSGDQLTVVRGQDGTAAQGFAAGSAAELRINRAVIQDSVTTATTAATSATASASTASAAAAIAAPAAVSAAASATAAAASAATATDAAVAMAIALG
jgi:hypothetical protein